MNCVNLHKYLSVKDFECVGVVAKHCNLEKLCIAIEQAKYFDLIPLFCYEFINDVFNNWGIPPDDEDFWKYRNLICETKYQSCNGKYALNMGLKKVWVYYSYARYLLINQINDSPNGAVRKENEWSIPIPLKEITDLSNQYREMGKEAFKSVRAFICRKKDEYTHFNTAECKECECGECRGGRTKKITGVRYTTIRK